jgi:hypothetical protein
MVEGVLSGFYAEAAWDGLAPMEAVLPANVCLWLAQLVDP